PPPPAPQPPRGCPFPRACRSPAALKGAYRFFDHPDTTVDRLLPAFVAPSRPAPAPQRAGASPPASAPPDPARARPLPAFVAPSVRALARQRAVLAPHDSTSFNYSPLQKATGL